MIRKVGDKWVLFSKDGSKRLGTHDTEEGAHAQERAIEASKHARNMRGLHLRVALGPMRTEFWEGREHYVVPVVALQEGVIHAINAPVAEFVSADTLAKTHHRWNGHPLVVGHPVKDGRQISAHDPIVLAKHGCGIMRSAFINGNRLGVEALVDPDKLQRIGHQKLLEDIRAGKPIEVSVGAYVRTNGKHGRFNGKEYRDEWEDITPDHLAFLPDGVGACSVESGCGANRAAMHLVTAESIEIARDKLRTFADVNTRTALSVVTKECAACGGTGSKGGNPCEVCDGTGELKTAADAANFNEVDMNKKELVKTLIGCPCSGFTADDESFLEAMAEPRLSSLVTFSNARKKIDDDLKAAQIAIADADTKLKAAEAKATATEAQLTAVQGKLTATETALRTATEKQWTEEEFLKVAPPSIRTLVEEKKKQDELERNLLLVQLKVAAANIYTEDELKTKSTADLIKLAQMAKLDLPDYSGRGLSRTLNKSEQNDYTPPDPYEAGLKALQGKVN